MGALSRWETLHSISVTTLVMLLTEEGSTVKHISSAAFALWVMMLPAMAQGVVQQSGAIVPNHPAAFQASGVIFDPGPANGILPGGGINELLLVVPPTASGSAQPWSNTGTGPFGANECSYDGFINGPRHYLCFTPNGSTGGPVIAYGALGGATPTNLTFEANGTAYPFPFTVGGIVGPATSVVNDVACWNNLVGSLLKDCGSFDLTVGTTTIASGTSGRVLYDNAGVLGELAVTGSGNAVLATSPTLVTPTLTSPTLTSPTMTAPTLGVATATSLNGLTITTSTGTLTVTGSKVFTVNNTITLAGTDGTTWTGPTTSATLLSTGGATLNAQPSNPSGTTSTGAFVMAGLGSTCHITPVNSTRLLVTFTGVLLNGTTNDGVSVKMAYGAGTAPANAASASGTIANASVSMFASSANFPVPFSSNAIITGLTPSTAYWLDLQQVAVTGGAGSMQSITCAATEI
jgi:hypothetical protein